MINRSVLLLGIILGAGIVTWQVAMGSGQGAPRGNPATTVVATDFLANTLDSVDVTTHKVTPLVTGLPGNPDSVLYIGANTVLMTIQHVGIGVGRLITGNTKSGAWRYVGGDFSNPYDMALTPAGTDVYISNHDTAAASAIYDYNIASGQIVTVCHPGFPVDGMVFSTGNLFVTSHSLQQVMQIKPDTCGVIGQPVKVVGADGLTWDPDHQTLLVAGYGAVYRYNPSKGTVQSYITGTFGAIDGVTADGVGNVFLADTTSGNLYLVPSGQPAKHILLATPSSGSFFDDVAPENGGGAVPSPTPTGTPSVPTFTPTPVMGRSINWTTFGYDAGRSHNNPAETKITTQTVGSLVTSWSFTAAESVSSSPAISGTTAYASSDNGVLYAVSTVDGTQLWAYNTHDVVRSSPTAAGTLVYVGTRRGVLYALDSATGAVAWQYQVGNAIDGAPAVVNGQLYVACYDGTLTALNAASGAFVWKLTTESAITGSPAASATMVYVGNLDGIVYGVDQTTGKKAWTNQTGYRVDSTPAYANGVVYVAGSGGRVFALDAATGSVLWQYQAGGLLNVSPAVDSHAVYLGVMSRILLALDVNSGSVLWTAPTTDTIDTSAAIANDIIYDGGQNGTIGAWDARNGQLLWHFTAPKSVQSSPAVVNGVLYIGSGNGTLYAFAPDSSH